jgi:hypothetical protein
MAPLNSDGGWPALPPRHFPSFSASERLGGGFVCGLQPSNARHARHLTPRHPEQPPARAAATAQSSPASAPARTATGAGLGGPEALARATAEGLAAAASSFNGTLARGGAVFQHVRAQPAGSSDSSSAPAAAASLQCRAPPPALPAAVLAALAAARRAEAPRALEFPSANFHAALATPHSRWHHDGTDFSCGRATQRLPWGPRTQAQAAGTGRARRPSTAPPQPVLASAGRASRVHVEPSGGDGSGANPPSAEGALAASVTRVHRIDGSSFGGATQPAFWFTDKSLEELRIQHDRERAATASGAVFVPRRGAAHPARSARLLRGWGPAGCAALDAPSEHGGLAVAGAADGSGCAAPVNGRPEEQADWQHWVAVQACKSGAGAWEGVAAPPRNGAPPTAAPAAEEAAGAEVGPETAAAIFAATAGPRWWEGTRRCRGRWRSR